METDQIETLAQAIAARLQPPVPLDRALWTAADCAAYLRVTARTVAERYAARPDFPKALKLPGSKAGHMRWMAKDVMRWAEGRKG